MLRKLAREELADKRAAVQLKREENGFNLWNLMPLQNQEKADTIHTEIDESLDESESETESTPTDDGEEEAEVVKEL